ncbi:hypothetical protein P7C70_g9152, partial [Phenoliferia sp. Uapishka_3]
MSSWLTSLLFKQSDSTPPSSPRPTTPTRYRTTHAPSLSPELDAHSTSASSNKRDRGWLPHSSSTDAVPRIANGVKAEGNFDTVRSYLSAAAEGGSRDDAARGSGRGWTPPDIPKMEDGEEDEVFPPNKKRKGIAGAVLSTALDAAIFTTALGYSAYQLWKNPPSSGNEDIDFILAARSRSRLEAPPPYAEHANSPPHTRPSQIPRRIVRHAHSPIPRLTSRRSNNGSTSTSPSHYTLAIPKDHPDEDDDDTGSMKGFRFSPQLEALPKFHPFRKFSGIAPPPGLMNGECEDEEEEEDEEMNAVAERLKNLIDAGRDALMSGPPDTGSAGEEGRDEEGERPLPKPVVAPGFSSRLSRGGGGGGGGNSGS